jgi:hypothetical protein
MACWPAMLDVLASTFLKSATSTTRVTEARRTPDPGTVMTFAFLRDALGSPARATLRERTDVWSAVVAKLDVAVDRLDDSDI